SVVLWSVDTEDWSGVSTDHIVNAVRQGIKDGGIILCHDFLTSKCHTAEALRIIIPELLAEGYEFVTVSELMA
ncbi:MAG: chitooligosaccharide deacetylase, partial [Clostridia bacterium]|nr:chitooligosaccharide deacetylase [Clostridia bacterium]